jgi:predicted lipid-binding transport protein (Tim44 family)
LMCIVRAAQDSYRPRTMHINNVRSSQSAAKAAASAKPAVVDTIVAPAPVAVPDPAQIAVQQAASAMFEQANRARRNGRLDQAATLYESLQREYGTSPEAKLSYALSARMWLDAGNAFAAYGAFERYLAIGRCAKKR